MKRAALVFSGLADEPLEDLQDRTPLEAARTPHFDRYAAMAELGQAQFIPSSLNASNDVALLALLGYDPEEFYTGLAPLEAPFYGLSQKEGQILFRCDFVTILEDRLMDASAGNISDKEAELLVEAINRKIGSDKIKLQRATGHKNFLVIQDPDRNDAYDALECVPPSKLGQESVSKHLPKGKMADLIIDWMRQAGEILENNEINRVRIDLGENPANRIWVWGQGAKPMLPLFEKRHGMRGAVYSKEPFVNGLAKLIGMTCVSSIKEGLHSPFFLYYEDFYASGEAADRDWKQKIKWIEEIDSKILPLVEKILKDEPDKQVWVGTDLAPGRRAPFMIADFEPGDASKVFSEKSAHHGKLHFEKGHRMMEHFLKK